MACPSVCRVKISVITKEWPPAVYGGAGVHAVELTRALRASGVDVSVHAFGEPEQAPDYDPITAAINAYGLPQRRPGASGAGNDTAPVSMGGGFFEGGNVTPAAEFNFYVDPQAAHEVFTSGVPITMAPLDVTHEVLTTAARIAAIRALPNRVGQVVAAWMEFFERYDEEKYGQDGGPLHDPCVIAFLLKPELFTSRECNVRIETQSPLTRGMSVIDWWAVTGLPANAQVLRHADADGFFALLTERLSRLG